MGTLDTTANMKLGSSFSDTTLEPVALLTNLFVLGEEDKPEDGDNLKRK